ncbi:hypothetical protein T10_149 [Trichinella papuae]|uniref:Uncharacterized protein n=1 Tax=Trichinella papuae TaxID=268474 RepID=A0A0V1MLZ1_9BILA|nr:hypothetical protein T10_149 [Trichinella papuae]
MDIAHEREITVYPHTKVDLDKMIHHCYGRIYWKPMRSYVVHATLCSCSKVFEFLGIASMKHSNASARRDILPSSVVIDPSHEHHLYHYLLPYPIIRNSGTDEQDSLRL